LEGLKVPLIPRHFANASVYWHSTNRWLLSATSTYRSARYSDEGNLAPLAAGWNFGIASYWESEDKRFAVEAGLGNLHANKQSSSERLVKFSLNGIVRF
jgi:outer membrane receptor protein involved in Fe transport